MGTLKTISIGDIHGMDTWNLINPDEYDKIIFVGDYVDSFHAPNITILENLQNIIQFKKDYPDKVVTLLGNHDLQYLFSYKDFGCSGYRSDMYAELHELFNENISLFQAAYGVTTDSDKYVWTHAGIHTGWYWQKFMPTFKGTPTEEHNVADQINKEFEKRNPTLFHVGHLRGGYHEVGGPFWVDKRISSKKPLKYVHQIVGHTRADKIEQFDIDLYTSITFIDCLDHEGKFYKLNIYDTE